MSFIKYNFVTPTKLFDDEYVLFSDFHSYDSHFIDGFGMQRCLAELGEQCYPCQAQVNKDLRYSADTFNLPSDIFHILCVSEKYHSRLNKSLKKLK